MSKTEYSRFDFTGALPAPKTGITVLDSALLEEAIQASRSSPRGRIILPLHKQGSDHLQRMLNAVQPGSYIRPHCHADPPKAESLLLLKGALCFLTFFEDGQVEQTFHLEAGSPRIGIDIDAGVMHTFYALEPDTLIFECKPGPYVADQDKQFASWAPEEGSAQAADYLAKLKAISGS